MKTLVLATQNPKKGRELAELARGRFLVRTLADVGLAGLDIDERGATFADNARIKARAVKAALPPGLARETAWVLADDSGLVVDALDGKPGVRSARFAADHGTGEGDEANNDLLLLLLAPVPDERRAARFACAVCALAVDGDAAHEAFGTVEGHIARDRAGSGGFGYDPLFIPVAHAPLRMAELSAEQKHAISHRGQAMRAVLAALDGAPTASVFARVRPGG
ncbi:MAG: hypothetical protein A2138_07055 [Deltaproteobacteria bacterium RBG_16_71_12]|nr:MAG: hypothetical protein A2138_07055 [Deltaproteobacteria bacterium RBG_16_71_12]